MKKRNLLVGMVLAVGLAIAGCGTGNNSEITRVEQEGTQADVSEGMQANAPKSADNNSGQDALNMESSENAGTDTSKDAEISEQKAREIALIDAGVSEADVQGIRVEKDFDDGRHQYDIDFYAGNKEYDYEIDIYTGDILGRDFDIEDDFEYEQSAQTSNYISKEEAMKLVLDRVAGATEEQVIMELDEDDGHLIYEGEVHYNNREYEFEMNAENGKILEWSEESAID